MSLEKMPRRAIDPIPSYRLLPHYFHIIIHFSPLRHAVVMRHCCRDAAVAMLIYTIYGDVMILFLASYFRCGR